MISAMNTTMKYAKHCLFKFASNSRCMCTAHGSSAKGSTENCGNGPGVGAADCSTTGYAASSTSITAFIADLKPTRGSERMSRTTCSALRPTLLITQIVPRQHAIQEVLRTVILNTVQQIVLSANYCYTERSSADV